MSATHVQGWAPAPIPMPLLQDLERRVQRALHKRNVEGLKVIGYGDSSVVLICDVGDRQFACKRLPPFPSLNDFRIYNKLLERYIAELQLRGLTILQTDLRSISTEDGGCVAYCVQPAVDRQSLLPQYLAACSREDGEKVLDRLLEIVVSVVSTRIGLDPDVSNWCWFNGQLTLLDVTTPMLRDKNLNEELNFGVFLSSLPTLLQVAVKSVGMQKLIGKFYSRRDVLVDMLAGLYREGVQSYAPYFMERANLVVEAPISVAELRRYCILNEATWSARRRLQMLERVWRVRVRRRSYPFLLPPKQAFAGRLTAFPRS